MTDVVERAKLGPYEHVFDGTPTVCILCGWQPPAELPQGTSFGRGRRSFAGVAELKTEAGEPVFVGLVEKGPFVVQESVHAGWIDWNESNAPLCRSSS